MPSSSRGPKHLGCQLCGDSRRRTYLCAQDFSKYLESRRDELLQLQCDYKSQLQHLVEALQGKVGEWVGVCSGHGVLAGCLVSLQTTHDATPALSGRVCSCLKHLQVSPSFSLAHQAQAQAHALRLQQVGDEGARIRVAHARAAHALALAQTRQKALLVETRRRARALHEAQKKVAG